MSNDGRTYEAFVKDLQQALLDSEDICKQRNIKIEANKKLLDNCGVEREFDLYWEYELAGITYKTIIECKDYASSVTIEKIDALVGKTRDIPDLKAVFATKTGYQSGAKAKALSNKIDLLIVREQRDEDWIDDDGTPYLKGVDIHLTVHSVARIISFKTVADGEWVRQNTDYDISQPISIQERNDEIFIEDIEAGDRFSILQLQGRLVSDHEGKPGRYSKTMEYKHAFIWHGDQKLKLRSFTVEYQIAEPIILPISIDYSKELKGVIEYLHKGSTTAIFRDKIVQNW